ncbi:MAG: sigma-54 dependent transcriptional regulator [Bdellovibrionota bacterium]|nr:nitrogen fixation protein NifA [Pseudobdellovibrionaceae bacterium]|tara:strand:- start:58227 stop:59783 length:1557 start_codon:yes stop_codon:yes gene_type:complete
MINWEEFDHIHVIKKLKHILHSWWNVDIIFTDDKGYLRGADRDEASYCNDAVRYYLMKDSCREQLVGFANRSLQDLRQSGNKYLVRTWDVAGFDVAVVPIVIEGELMGSVLCLGFWRDNHEEDMPAMLRERLAAFGADSNVIEAGLSKVRTLREQDRQHFVDLVDLVGQEVVTLHLEISSREDRINELNKELGGRYKYDNMIGKSKPMQDLYSLMDKIKAADSTVLITGENGTGKELIAKAIHYNSMRKNHALVIQNCSAFNDNLLESELFGHIKGSFTGAVKDKKGLFEMAHKGTFFLDEIGDTSPSMQVKLLRVLQEGTFIPVGGVDPRRVDVRVLAATNKDLKKMVEEGSFREDLYYRLNVIHIQVPSLKERKEDIPLLIEYFLENAAKAAGQQKKVMTKKALERLYDYSWPGNIRELQNEVERLVVLASHEQKLTPEMLSARIQQEGSKQNVQGARVHGKLKDALEELEMEMISEGLRRTGWNKSKLAKELGISRAGLIMKVEKYGLDKRKMNR